MASTGSTPISLYYSATASNVPLAANLVAGELAMNTADGKIFYKDSSGVVQTMASKATGAIGGSNTQVQFNNSGVLGGSANLTFNGTTLTAAGLAGPLNGTVGATTPNTGAFTTTTVSTSETLSYGTANGVTYLNGSKVLTSGSALTFDGTTLTSSVGTSAANTIFNSSANTPYIRFDQSNAAKFYIGESSAVGGGGAGNYDLYAASGLGIRFFANAAEQMRLTSTGLGIGTSSPAAKLDVQGGGAVIQLKQNAAGAATYYVMDNTVETGGKRWRFGYSGAAGIPCFSLYNQTDNVTSWVADASGNLGLGVTPSAWDAGYKAIQIASGQPSALMGAGNQTELVTNAYYGSSAWRYVGSSVAASRYSQQSGIHYWFTAPSGTAGNAITFTQAMTLDASGNLGIGTTSLSNYANQTTFTINGTNYGRLDLKASNTLKGSIIGGGDGLLLDAGANQLVMFAGGSERARIDSSGNLIQTVNTTAATLTQNQTLTFSIVNNSLLRISVRGSDGTTRTATIALV